jgi:hypothetical protein
LFITTPVVPSEKKIVVFDRVKREVVASWPLKEADKNYPMALDQEHRLLFVGCRAPARLLVLNAQSGASVTSIPIGGDVDDVFFDAQRHLLYLSCGEGFIDIFSQETVTSYKRVERVPTRKGARTSVFVPSLNTFILAVPKMEDKEAELRVYSIKNP